jgi:predicted nucleic acid-binding protein
VIRALVEEEDRAREIIARHSDKDWSLCDAISFAVLDARRIRRAFTFDRHFLQYGRIEILGLSR